jgi:hypothetical protein
MDSPDIGPDHTRPFGAQQIAPVSVISETIRCYKVCIAVMSIEIPVRIGDLRS